MHEIVFRVSFNVHIYMHKLVGSYIYDIMPQNVYKKKTMESRLYEKKERNEKKRRIEILVCIRKYHIVMHFSNEDINFFLLLASSYGVPQLVLLLLLFSSFFFIPLCINTHMKRYTGFFFAACQILDCVALSYFSRKQSYTYFYNTQKAMMVVDLLFAILVKH